jgi:putative membrane protein insertion efficiency factor
MMRLRRLATLPLRVYRRWISPLKPPMCRFAPTCSQYAIEAIELHGILRGFGYALLRIVRCHPLCKGGFDPVPGSDAARNRAHACSGELSEPTSAAQKTAP